MMKKLSIPSFFLFSLFCTATPAHNFKETLSIVQATARPTVPQQVVGATYLTIENRGNHLEKLLAASTPIASSVELHKMSMEDGVMRMRNIEEITIPPHSKLTMQPGNGYHLMLIGLKQPLQTGGAFPLQLTFKNAGKLSISAQVMEQKK